MKKIKLLIIGYSKFAENRLIKSIKKIALIDFRICSKTKVSDNVHYDNYLEGLNFKPDLIYISLVNNLHYTYAKFFLKKGYNVIVDKPLAENLLQTVDLIKIAKKNKVLLSEATLFNYHSVFKKILNIIGGKNNIKLLQSNFNVPQLRPTKNIIKTKSDCFMDMSPYAASLIRLFLNPRNIKINSNIETFKNKKFIKSFYIFARDKSIKYFGNFSLDREYLSQIIFYTKNKVIYLPHQAFALPATKKIKVIIKMNNSYKSILFDKDDCIRNYFYEIINCIKKKKYKKLYNILIYDAKLREMIKHNFNKLK